MLWLGLRLLGLRRALGAGLRWLMAKPLRLALLAVLVLGVIAWREHGYGVRQAARAELAEVALKTQIADYRKAYREAYRRAWAAKIAEETRSARIKENIDVATRPARASALAAAAAYADRHRVQPGAGRGAGGAARKPGVPGAPAAPRGPDGSEAGAELVAIVRADLDACTLNTRDLWLAMDWGAELVRRPEPVEPVGSLPSPGFGE